MQIETYVSAYGKALEKWRLERVYYATLPIYPGDSYTAGYRKSVEEMIRRERQYLKFFHRVRRDAQRLRQERDSALAALAAAQAMTQELAQMRTLIVEVRDKVARLERQLMTADERRLAEVHRAGK